MRKIPRSFVYLFAATCWVVPAAAQTSDHAPALRDGSHDMDFNFGTWHTEITRIPDPFDDPSKVVRLSGTLKVLPLWNGKGQVEQIEADGPEGRWAGANFFFYDPAAHQWLQSFVDASTGHFEGPPGAGEYRNGNIEYYSPSEAHGRAVLDRAIWSDFTPNSHTYTESFSDDGGRTWHPAFIAHVTRIKR